MTIKSINNETVITIPQSVNYNYLQNFIDYLSVKAIISTSQASDQEINEISENAQKQWWSENKAKFLK